MVGITGRLPDLEGAYLGFDPSVVIDRTMDLLPIGTTISYLLHSYGVKSPFHLISFQKTNR